MTNLRSDREGPPGARGARGAQDWETPPALFRQLHERFAFTVDAASSHDNALLPRHWTEEDDALSLDWSGERVYCNPPFQRLDRWAEKAHAEAGRAQLIVYLVPANLDTKWWHEHVWGGAASVAFVKGRVQFWRDGAPGESTLASGAALVGWWPSPEPRPRVTWGYTWPGRQRGWVSQ